MKSLQNIEHASSLVFRALKNARLQYLGFIFHFFSLLVVNHEEGDGAGYVECLNDNISSVHSQFFSSNAPATPIPNQDNISYFHIHVSSDTYQENR